VNQTLTSNGAVNRISAYLIEVKIAVERGAHPAYVWYAGSSQDQTLDAWAASQHLPHTGYARYVVDGYAVYYYPAAS
jgi:hypothetical protein